MVRKKLEEKALELCDKALEMAAKNVGVIPLEFSSLNSLTIEKISNYLKEKNRDDRYIILELKGNSFYEAHIKYKKHNK